MNEQYIYINKTGTVCNFTSKEGGGKYTVVGNVNCSRCNQVIEDREWTEPSKKHRKKGHYYARYKWCPYCGLFEPELSSLTDLLK